MPEVASSRALTSTSGAWESAVQLIVAWTRPTATGAFAPEAIERTRVALVEYADIIRETRATAVRMVATSATRDASNREDFFAMTREVLGAVIPGAEAEVITGDEEARLSADGLLLGVPRADGLLGDLGGGSLELVRLSEGRIGEMASLPLGTIRLADHDIKPGVTSDEGEGDAWPALREQILALVNTFHDLEFAPREFVPGETPVPVSGRVFDADDLLHLVDASLDFWLTTGRFAARFEREFARWFGVRHAVLVNSGSSANLVALSCLTSPTLGDRRLRPGDEVITVAAGFPTTVNPIIQNNLVPVFVDVHLPTYNIDVTQLEPALSDRTRAVMVAGSTTPGMNRPSAPAALYSAARRAASSSRASTGPMPLSQRSQRALMNRSPPTKARTAAILSARTSAGSAPSSILMPTTPASWRV